MNRSAGATEWPLEFNGLTETDRLVLETLNKWEYHPRLLAAGDRQDQEVMNGETSINVEGDTVFLAGASLELVEAIAELSGITVRQCLDSALRIYLATESAKALFTTAGPATAGPGGG